jgi:hypothetical protein
MFRTILTALSVEIARGGANEPIPNNMLGTYANACAESFCQEKDGLELWLTLYQARNIEYIEPVWTAFEVANLCVMIAISGFTFGFLIEKFAMDYFK